MNRIKVLVTGGAGYIGSHLVNYLLNNNYDVTVIDDLSTGTLGRLIKGAEFIKCDIRDFNKLNLILSSTNFDAIFHLAAKKSVIESVSNSTLYESINRFGTEELVRAANLNAVKNLIFSSTCAVYGQNQMQVVNERSPINPISPYGHSKYQAEKLIFNSYKHNICILRYFNVIGESEIKFRDINQDSLVPSIIKSLTENRKLQIYGKDYPTKDGTCERDYIDVRDIVSSHVDAYLVMKKFNESLGVINLGYGEPKSVLNIVNKVQQIIGKKIDYEFKERRRGDVSIVYSDNSLAKKLINFNPIFTVDDALESVFLNQFGS